MKILAFIVTGALALGSAAPASAIEVLTNHHAVLAATQRQPDLAPAAGSLLLPSAQLSELPEPEVFAMMLLGLVLIGYRTSRNSDEKFK